MAISSFALIISVIFISKVFNCNSPLPKWLSYLALEGSTLHLVENDGTKVKTENGEIDKDTLKDRTIIYAEQWKQALQKLDRILLRLFITLSILLFVVVCIALISFSNQ